MYRGPRLNFYIPGLNTPISFKLLLSHLGDMKTISQEYKGSSANIDDMGIPFHIICNCYTEFCDTFNISQYCRPTLNGVLDFLSYTMYLFRQLYYVAFDIMKS